MTLSDSVAVGRTRIGGARLFPVCTGSAPGRTARRPTAVGGTGGVRSGVAPNGGPKPNPGVSGGVAKAAGVTGAPGGMAGTVPSAGLGCSDVVVGAPGTTADGTGSRAAGVPGATPADGTGDPRLGKTPGAGPNGDAGCCGVLGVGARLGKTPGAGPNGDAGCGLVGVGARFGKTPGAGPNGEIGCGGVTEGDGVVEAVGGCSGAAAGGG